MSLCYEKITNTMSVSLGLLFFPHDIKRLLSKTDQQYEVFQAIGIHDYRR